MKKQTQIITLAVIGSLLAIVLFFSNGEKKSSPAKGHSTRVAIMLPLTGPAASGGFATKQGFDLAQKDILANGSQIELVYFDTKSEVKEAVSIYRQSVQGKNFSAVILELSSVTHAIKPLLDKTTFAVATAVAAPKISDVNSHLVRVFATSTDVATKAAHEIAKRNLVGGKIGIVHVNDDYGISSAKAFQDAFIKKGGKISSTETFSLTEREFKQQAEKLAALKLDAIWVTGYGLGYISAINQLREASPTTLVITDWSITSPDYLAAINNKNGIMVISPKISQKFSEDYKHLYNSDGFMVNIAFAYDTVKIIDKLNKEVGGESQKMLNAFLALGTYSGVSGNIRIGTDGDTMTDCATYTIQENQLKIIE